MTIGSRSFSILMSALALFSFCLGGCVTTSREPKLRYSQEEPKLGIPVPSHYTYLGRFETREIDRTNLALITCAAYPYYDLEEESRIRKGILIITMELQSGWEWVDLYPLSPPKDSLEEGMFKFERESYNYVVKVGALPANRYIWEETARRGYTFSVGNSFLVLSLEQIFPSARNTLKLYVFYFEDIANDGDMEILRRKIPEVLPEAQTRFVQKFKVRGLRDLKFLK